MAHIPDKTRRAANDVGGAHIEIIDTDATGPDSGRFLLPKRVIVNGTDVGRVAENGIHISPGNSDTITTVTITLIPSRIEIKGAGGFVAVDSKILGME